MNQVELARSVGRSEGAVSRWLDGKTAPAPNELADLSEALHIPADQLLGLERVTYRPADGASIVAERRRVRDAQRALDAAAKAVAAARAAVEAEEE